MRRDLYISVDIESDGPIPGDYSMISLGAAVATSLHLGFYTEFKPISDRFDPKALAVSGLDRDELIRTGEAPELAMKHLLAGLVGYQAETDRSLSDLIKGSTGNL